MWVLKSSKENEKELRRYCLILSKWSRHEGHVAPIAPFLNHAADKIIWLSMDGQLSQEVHRYALGIIKCCRSGRAPIPTPPTIVVILPGRPQQILHNVLAIQ